MFSDDDISPGVADLENADSNNGRPGRKRAATTHDPKKTKIKKPRPMEMLCSQMAEAMEIFKEPVRISDSNERWLGEALEIWNSEFQGISFAVQHAMYGKWSQNLRDARIFVQSSREYRRWLVEKTEQDLGLKDVGGHIAAAGEEE